MFGFLSHNLFVNHVAENTTGLSPRLWNRVTGSMMSSDGSKRLVLVGDDFTCVKATNTSTVVHSDLAYTSYIDSGNTITGLADEKGGVIALTLDASGDNEETWMESGDATSVLGAISDTAGADYLTAFECRVKTASIANTVNWFVGLAEEGLAAGDTVSDADDIASKDLIGFAVDAADGDAIDFIYRKAGQTLNTHKTGGVVPVADTFMKLGFIYDPSAPAAKRITWYVDNVEQTASTDYVTATDIATADFPDAEELCFLAGLKSQGAVAHALEMDWWGFAQVITT